MKRIGTRVGLTLMLFAVSVSAQHLVETIKAPPATYWPDIVLYETGGKLFIADNTNKQILVYDPRTLVYLEAISLSAILPGTPRSLALHEGTGTLYASISGWAATSDSTIAIIDADTYEIIDTLTDINLWRAKIAIDESRARLYAYGYNGTLMAVDINTNTIVGSLDVEGLFTESGIIDFSKKRGLNPVTGELLFASRQAEQFVIVDGPSLTGGVVLADGSRGWGEEATWNSQENKLYIPLMGGFFIYDRDTGTSNLAGGSNDAMRVFYSQATNRVYSGAEVNGESTVIEGETDAWQNIAVGAGLPAVGFVNATHHAYFVDAGRANVLDEETLTSVAYVYGGGAPLANFVGTEVEVDQNQKRVFCLGNWQYPEDGASVAVIDDEELLTITSPAGGELWRAGSSHNITWTDTGTTANVKIEYSIDNGSTWKTLVASTPDTHSYLWNLPHIGCFACLVRIIDADDASVRDISDEVFSIFIPFGWALDNSSLSWSTGGDANWMGETSVSYYGGSAAQSGSLWDSGDSSDIQTTVSGPGNLGFFWKVSSYYYSSEYYNYLAFYIDDVEQNKIGGEVEWQQQVYEIGPGTHTLKWRYYQVFPPDPDCLNAAWLDKVEYTPLIIDSITVTSPDGGEHWPAGSAQDITWTSTGTIPSVKIEYSMNNGSSYATIIASTANDGTHSWTVPDTPSADCRVRVSDASKAAIADVSDAVFSIEGVTATLTVTSPSGGESWVAGSAHDITWSSTGTVANVKIELSTNGGASFTTITASTANDGTHPWTLPSEVSSNCLIRISDAANAAVNDMSNGTFSIVSMASLRLTWTSGYSGTPAIAVGASGRLHAVWQDNTPGNYEIYYKRSTNGGSSWTASQRLTYTSGNSTAPAVAEDASGNLHVVWQDNTPGNADIYYKKSTNGGMTWTTAKKLTSTSSASQNPDIAIDASGNPHVVWQDYSPGNNEIYYKNSTNGGASWNANKRLTWTAGTSGFPAIGTGPSGRIHVAWQDDTSGNYEVYYLRSTNSGATWVPSKRVTWNSGGSEAPAIGLLPSGNPHIVWRDNTPGNYEVYYRKSTDGGATWAASQRLSWTSGASNPPDMAVGPASHVSVIWADTTPGNSEIYLKRSANWGTSWATDKRLTWSSGGSEVPSVGTDSSGNLHIIWQENKSGNYEIYYLKF